MHVICNKQLLVEAVSNVSRAVSSRNTLAALEGILLKTAAGTISLTVCFPFQAQITNDFGSS